jgi:hypothetical protein
MDKRVPGLKRRAALSALALAILLALSAVIWRRDIVETTLDPKQPFQTYSPPPAPDYDKRSAWALLPATPSTWAAADPAADVFFVYPTIFNGGRDWLSPINDPAADAFLTHTILPNYAGPFARVGRLFAPRYRQASLYTQLSIKDDAHEAREFAYGDVRRAFDFYLDHFNAGRPIVVAGLEQGGTLVERLMSDEMAARPNLAGRIAAVYEMDSIALADAHRPGSALPACTRRGEPHCVVGWADAFKTDHPEIKRILKRSLVWNAKGRLEDLDDRPILCVNPVLGVRSDALAPPDLNRGAVSASEIEWGVRPAFLRRQVSAQCTNGVLIVSTPTSPSLRKPNGWLAQIKEPGFNLFYEDLEVDALARLAGFPKPAPPIETTVVVKSAPVHRVTG